jgi:hypothetical protein
VNHLDPLLPYQRHHRNPQRRLRPLLPDHLDNISLGVDIQDMAASCHSVVDTITKDSEVGEVTGLLLTGRTRNDMMTRRGNGFRMSRKSEWYGFGLRLHREKRKFGKPGKPRSDRKNRNGSHMHVRPRSIKSESGRPMSEWIKIVGINSDDISIKILHFLQRRLSMMLYSRSLQGGSHVHMNTRPIRGTISTLLATNDLEWMLLLTTPDVEMPTSRNGVKMRIEPNHLYESEISVT